MNVVLLFFYRFLIRFVYIIWSLSLMRENASRAINNVCRKLACDGGLLNPLIFSIKVRIMSTWVQMSC